ncbi:MAG: hypothetical protein KDI56_08155 [Xanthomonadales bacterium]|nr:hypothetical protein [Xanthomonadales bacterium]MCB1634105.1 hypothetical protein [Xanthomonadales bacterium]
MDLSSGQGLYLHEWPEGLGWVNTDEAPRLADLRGKVVLLVFFNASVVHGHQLLEELKPLQNRYHDGLAVVGMHTPKYAHETHDSYVLKAINRLHLRFPVANDKEYVAWRRLAVQAWPTTVILDCEGRLVGIFPGCGRVAEIEARIESLLDQAGLADQRNYEPLPAARKPETRKALSFPAAIVAGENHLYVADSSLNRILEVSPTGHITRVFGSGNAGLWDARGTEAGFNRPQGLAISRDQLFVADTGNHAVRRVKLANGEVETLCGTGKLADLRHFDMGLPKQTPLASPMDVAIYNERLFIAVAGFQQILELDLGRDRLSILAGNGREDLADGSGNFASFAEPCGLSVGRDSLYVADSGNSALRAVRLADARVQTLLGLGPFDFGDVDGNATLARLQHPMAVHVDAARNLIWLCDSFNNKLKVYALNKGEVKTINLKYALTEPMGLCVAKDAVWIANTGAHEILRLDLKGGKLSRLPIGDG